MNKPRSLIYMLAITLLFFAVAIGLYSLVPKIDIKPYDQKKMNGEARYRAGKMLNE